MTKIGVISDTHGLMRPEATEALIGSDMIVHAGDIGSCKILEALERIAPLKAIRGNVDKWAADMGDTEVFEVDGRYFYVLHDIKELDLDPASAEIDVVISGHSHKPDIRRDNGVLYLNPGSAGPRRFTLPVTLAKLTVTSSAVEAKIVTLVQRDAT